RPEEHSGRTPASRKYSPRARRDRAFRKGASPIPVPRTFGRRRTRSHRAGCHPAATSRQDLQPRSCTRDGGAKIPTQAHAPTRPEATHVALCFAISWDRFEKEISRRSLLFRFGYGQWTAHLVRTIHICASDMGFGSLTVAKALRAGVRDGDTVPEHRAVEVEFEIDDLRLRLGRRG